MRYSSVWNDKQERLHTGTLAREVSGSGWNGAQLLCLRLVYSAHGYIAQQEERI